MARYCNTVRALALALTCLCFCGGGANAAGLLTPANGQLPGLEIRQHHVTVAIEDSYAVTTVEQTFYNPSDQVLEAIYSFPLPENAAVGEFTYWIEGKAVTGEVVEKERGREIYREEKAQGREVALLEQDGYRSFDSLVYPVQARDSVRIRLVYLQPVHTDLGIGRYVYPLEEGGVDEQKLAFWNFGDAVQEAFSFKLHMRSAYPIEEFRLPGHPEAVVTQPAEREWDVAIEKGVREADDGTTTTAPAEAYHLDRDIVVYWRHRKDLPGAIDMIAHKPPGSDRGTFMMTITPGDDLAPIRGGRDWIFVLDVSGSMQGKYHSLVEGVRRGLTRLNPDDRFRIVLFNNGARELTHGYTVVTEQTIARYTALLDSTGTGGGTNLYAGLERAFHGLDADRPSAIILVSDGVANVGITEKKQFLTLLEKHDVRLFSFVMGNSANRPLLQGMATVSNGLAMTVSNSDDITGRLLQAVDKLGHQAYRDIAIGVSGVRVRDLTPGRIGSLYRGQQLTVFGHYWGDGEAELEFSGVVAGERRVYRSRFDFPAGSTLYPEVERMWAFASIEDLQRRIDYLGEDSDTGQAILDLALEYGLVTDYTSMIVVHDELFAQYGLERNNGKRVAAEQAARARRSSSPVSSHRRDAGQPAFAGNRAYPDSGAGATGPWMLLLLLPLILLGGRRDRIGQTARPAGK